jgi:predicted AlkP superfamily phosphohydrolase/phosphomutase
VLAALDRVGIDDDDLLELVPRTVADRVATRLPGDHVLYDVDYADTTAFVHGDGNLYVNDTRRFEEGTVDPAEVPTVKRELCTVLGQVTDPETGKPALDVADGDGLFPADDDAPDLVVTGRDGYEVLSSLTDDAFRDTDAKAASHRSQGVFMAWGPNVDAGVTVQDASVVDVAPTVLHGVSADVPRDADGDVLHDVFAPDSPPGRGAVARRDYADRDDSATVDEDFSDVEDRLRGLGYME